MELGPPSTYVVRIGWDEGFLNSWRWSVTGWSAPSRPSGTASSTSFCPRFGASTTACSSTSCKGSTSQIITGGPSQSASIGHTNVLHSLGIEIGKSVLCNIESIGSRQIKRKATHILKINKHHKESRGAYNVHFLIDIFIILR